MENSLLRRMHRADDWKVERLWPARRNTLTL